MTETLSILPQSIAFDPVCDLEAFLKDVPAKWVVYLMTDESDRPVQLLCVKNLRYSLKRRLGEGDLLAGPSKRVDYRQIVRHIHWRRVFSAFEADAVYLEAARQCFPKTYRGMTGFQPAWFIHVNPDANFPRYTKTIDLGVTSRTRGNSSPSPGTPGEGRGEGSSSNIENRSPSQQNPHPNPLPEYRERGKESVAGELFGPIEDKHAAARLMEELVDLFDLCRYYNILVESPNATACAYKEMGKCPAPCDGSISMDQYRGLVKWSTQALIAPEQLIRDNTQRMKSAAAELHFESAAKIKAYIGALSKMGKGPFRHVRRLRDFQYLSIQRGPRDNTAKAFLITPGQIREICGLITEPINAGEILRITLENADAIPIDSLGQIETERVGVVAHHLFQAKAIHGAFLPLDSIDEKAIMKAFRDVQKQKKEETSEETEGVVKELQAL